MHADKKEINPNQLVSSDCGKGIPRWRRPLWWLTSAPCDDWRRHLWWLTSAPVMTDVELLCNVSFWTAAGAWYNWSRAPVKMSAHILTIVQRPCNRLIALMSAIVIGDVVRLWKCRRYNYCRAHVDMCYCTYYSVCYNCCRAPVDVFCGCAQIIAYICYNYCRAPVDDVLLHRLDPML